MDLHEDSPSGFVPDSYDRPGAKAWANSISPLRRRWRMPAVVTVMATAAALSLHGGAKAHAQDSSAKGAAPLARPVAGGNARPSIGGKFEFADSSSGGGVHGAFNLYEGVGGGIEFWFDPSTGDLTVAIGVGVGDGGGGVLGTFAPGSVPEAGTYVYANADLSAGTYGTASVGGTYSLSNNEFVGSASTTVDGRTVTIASDGSTTFDVDASASEDAPGFTGAVGVNHTFSFNVGAVADYIWSAISDDDTDDYTLDDNDDTGDDTSVYEDDSDTDDDTDLTTDDSDDDDDDATADDSDDDSDDSGDDGGDDGGDGGDAYVLHLFADHATSSQDAATGAGAGVDEAHATRTVVIRFAQ